jgi:germination protein YpeB
MEANYAQYYGGTALINFAYVQNDAIVYNDLIKVWIDRETLGIVGADARNYLFSHVERDIPTPTLSKEEAEAKVSVNLDIMDRQLALIPVTPTKERLCYEFKGKCDGDEYIVYIDAETGEEQQIFVIINTENGQLTL